MLQTNNDKACKNIYKSKSEQGYTIAPNEWLSVLTPREIQVAMYLRNLPATWRIYRENIAKTLKVSVSTIGRAFKKLRQLGMLIYIRDRHENGQYLDTGTYKFFDKPNLQVLDSLKVNKQYNPKGQKRPTYKTRNTQTHHPAGSGPVDGSSVDQEKPQPKAINSDDGSEPVSAYDPEKLDAMKLEAFKLIHESEDLTKDDITHLKATAWDFMDTLTTSRPRLQTLVNYLRKDLSWKRDHDRRAQQASMASERRFMKREAAREHKNNAIVAALNSQTARLVASIPKTTQQKLTDVSWADGLEIGFS